jgi:hypothetical protein
MKTKTAKTTKCSRPWMMALWVPALIVGGYVLWIMGRVSMAEAAYLGRSELIPMSFKPPKFTHPPIAESYGQQTMVIERHGINEFVWKQKINGYQHILGSAIAAYEIGDYWADKLFCANEFFEWAIDVDGIQMGDIRDRRKDLAHNKIGRRLGLEARARGIGETELVDYLSTQILDVMALDAWYQHCMDPRVVKLPDEAALGCPGLPKKNLFNYLRKRS